MREHGFATLISAPGGRPWATHLPLLVERSGDALLLRSHLARANPQWTHFPEADVLAIFGGPHALIDPSWYFSRPNVPTWDYIAVHAYGPARLVEGPATREIAYGLVQRYTPAMPPIPKDFEEGMLRAVVTFEIEVSSLIASYKLSQNKPAADQDSVAQHLAQSPLEHERAIARAISLLRERGEADR
jgi:transcriptional regulator